MADDYHYLAVMGGAARPIRLDRHPKIFVVGLFLGWMRWRSGSTLLTFFLHALFNVEGTLETVTQVYFFR